MESDNFDKTEHWHVRKEITWGHIITTIFLCMALVTGWINTTDNINAAHTKADTNTLSIEHIKEINRIRNTQFQASIDRVEIQYKDLNGKMDRLFDRLSKEQKER